MVGNSREPLCPLFLTGKLTPHSQLAEASVRGTLYPHGQALAFLLPITAICHQAPRGCPASSEPSYQKGVRNTPTPAAMVLGVSALPSGVLLVAFLPRPRSDVTHQLGREETRAQEHSLVLNSCQTSHSGLQEVGFIDFYVQDVNSSIITKS